MRKYITYIVLGLLLIGAILVINRRYNKGKKVEIFWRTVPIEKGDVTLLVTSTGALAADTSVDVGAQVNGIIAKIKVDFNSLVKRDQIIAVLDTTLYYAALVDAKASVQRAEIAKSEAQREYDRTKNLLDNKVAAQSDYDVALTNLQTAQGNCVSAKAQLDRAEINLKYCTIRSPIKGVVISRNVQVGNMVIASFNSPVLFTIAYDLTKMQVQANVDESDIGQIAIGQTAKFTVGAYPNDIFVGKVTQIRHQPITVQNVVNYVVIIEVDNPSLKLMPGLTANANILIDERKNVYKVPTSAFNFTPTEEYLQKHPNLPDSIRQYWLKQIHSTAELKKRQISESTIMPSYLWIKSGNDVYPVKVKRGLNDGTYTEIEGDIKEGYEVATGVNHSQGPEASQVSSSPFMPKFPTGKK